MSTNISHGYRLRSAIDPFVFVAFGWCSRRWPACRPWTTPSCMSPGVRASGVRRCGSARGRTSRC